jgi:iron complex outermembrane receptor protein
MAGLDKEFQGVLINGERPPGGGEKREFALDRIPIEQIDRIEILRNPTASHDSDAVAGIVNVILKAPPKSRTFSVSVAGSTFDLADRVGSKATLEYGDRTGPVGLSLAATHSDEYRPKRKQVEDLDKGEGQSEREDVQTLGWTANPALELRLGERSRVLLRSFLNSAGEDKTKSVRLWTLSTGAAKSRNEEAEDKVQFLQTHAFEGVHRFARGTSVELRASYSRNVEEKDKRTAQYTGAALAFSKNVFEAEEKVDGDVVSSLDVKSPHAGPFDTGHVLSAGAKIRRKDRSVDKHVREVNALGVERITSTPNDSYRVDETVTAVYLMDEASLADWAVLTPGLRMERTSGGYATAGGTEASDAFTDWNPSIHAQLKLGRLLQLRGSMARTIARPEFKAKVPTRVVKSDKIEEGNPDLRATSSLNYEAALEAYLGAGGVFSVGGFYKDVSDVVEKMETGIDGVSGLPVVKPVNAGDAIVRGVDAELKSDLRLAGLPEVTVIAAGSLLDSSVTDPTSGETRRLKDQPRTLARLLLRYEGRRNGLSAAIGVNRVGEKVDDSDPLKPRKVEEAFTQVDLSVSAELGKGARIFASAVNVLGEDRDVRQGGRTEREEVGRSFFAGVRADL